MQLEYVISNSLDSILYEIVIAPKALLLNPKACIMLVVSHQLQTTTLLVNVVDTNPVIVPYNPQSPVTH